MPPLSNEPLNLHKVVLMEAWKMLLIPLIVHNSCTSMNMPVALYLIVAEKWVRNNNRCGTSSNSSGMFSSLNSSCTVTSDICGVPWSFGVVCFVILGIDLRVLENEVKTWLIFLRSSSVSILCNSRL